MKITEVARHFMNLTQPKIMFSCESALEVLMEAAKIEKVDIKFVSFWQMFQFAFIARHHGTRD